MFFYLINNVSSKNILRHVIAYSRVLQNFKAWGVLLA